jgi:hypothetical protein
MNLTDTQLRVLANLDRTALYGPYKRVFASLDRKGLIRCGGGLTPANHHFHRTPEGDAVIGTRDRLPLSCRPAAALGSAHRVSIY